MADVEAMFHQVKFHQKTLTYFISKALVEKRMVVHLFGATSSLSCASYAFR